MQTKFSRSFVFLAILVVSMNSCSVFPTHRSKEKKTNFIIIFTDDQGYADLGCFGGSHVHTPNIDQMAAEGAMLTNFYAAAPLCTPSRAALMTGSYAKRVNLDVGTDFPVLLASDPKGLHPDEITIAEVLKSAGYNTGMFGKWHLGDQIDFLPTRQGFDEFFGIPYSHDIHPYHRNQKKFNFPPLPLLDGESVIEMDPDADYLIKRMTERTVDFIVKNKEHPFFIYMPHTSPHRPLLASPEFMENAPDDVKLVLSKEKDSIDYKTRDKIYPQTISEIDWSVGQILEALKKHMLEENTVVIFTSDNGPVIGSAKPLKGKKGSTYEGGMRMPTVVKWPGKILPGSVNSEMMTTMDLLPTFAALAGTEIPTDRVIDGKNVVSVLKGESKSPHESLFYYRQDVLEAVRSGKWKMRIAGASSPALYDLENDIGERNNVLEENKAIAIKLKSLADEFEKNLNKNSRPAGKVENPKALSK